MGLRFYTFIRNHVCRDCGAAYSDVSGHSKWCLDCRKKHYRIKDKMKRRRERSMARARNNQ